LVSKTLSAILTWKRGAHIFGSVLEYECSEFMYGGSCDVQVLRVVEGSWVEKLMWRCRVACDATSLCCPVNDQGRKSHALAEDCFQDSKLTTITHKLLKPDCFIAPTNLNNIVAIALATMLLDEDPATVRYPNIGPTGNINRPSSSTIRLVTSISHQTN